MDVVKGERFNLTKGGGGATDFYVGLGWDAQPSNGHDCDLDAVVFGLDANGKLVSDDYFVYFGLASRPGASFSSKDGSIAHSGDNLTGNGDGDDEQIRFYLGKLDPRVVELSIVVCIYDARKRGQNFGQVRKAYVQVANMDSAGNPPTDGAGNVQNLVRFPLSDDYSKHTSIQVGSIYKRDDGDWAFNPTGAGFENVELGDILANYTN